MRVVHLIFYYSRSGTKTSTCICTEQPIADDAINDLCIIIIMTIIENRSRNGPEGVREVWGGATQRRLLGKTWLIGRGMLGVAQNGDNWWQIT